MKRVLLIVKDSILRDRDYYFRLSQQADKIIVWLVGFSVTAIGIIIGNFNNENLLFEGIKDGLILFSTVTIFFGVLYRITYFIFQNIEIKLINGFLMYIESYINPTEFSIGRDIILEEHSADDIVKFIEEDFGEIINIGKQPSSIIIKDLVAQSDLKKSLEEKYYELQEKQEAEKIDELKNILNTQLGYSRKALDKSFKESNKKPRLVWVMVYASFLFFILSNIAFLAGIIYVLYKYMKYVS